MLIVAGAFVVAPEDRDAFLAGRNESIVSTRAEAGCLDYVLSADPVDPAKVVIFERWEDQASFDAHLAGLASGPRPSGPAPQSASALIYDIAGIRSLG
jgi:quinol monooxygenase YgiN